MQKKLIFFLAASSFFVIGIATGISFRWWLGNIDQIPGCVKDYNEPRLWVAVTPESLTTPDEVKILIEIENAQCLSGSPEIFDETWNTRSSIGWNHPTYLFRTTYILPEFFSRPKKGSSPLNRGEVRLQ